MDVSDRTEVFALHKIEEIVEARVLRFALVLLHDRLHPGLVRVVREDFQPAWGGLLRLGLLALRAMLQELALGRRGADAEAMGVGCWKLLF